MFLAYCYHWPIDRSSIGLGLSLTPSLGRDDTYDFDMSVTIFDHFRPRQKCPHVTACEPTVPLPRHEGECESDDEHLCGALDPVTDQNVNRGDVRSKNMTATTRHSFRVVITTRMIETVNRLVVVMHMAHSHHWAIRPHQLDVGSRADKHAAR